MSYWNTKGRIFDIQRFSIHDGIGIRTIVFLKGCILRCKWCCNPESQNFNIEKMIVNGKEKIIGKDVTVKEVVKIIEKDRAYYRRSCGGLTLSGGESLIQVDFARDLLRATKERGINTTLESTACSNYENIEQILPFLDFFLMDIKHVNSQKHELFTGKSNELILENAQKIAKSRLTKLIIRVPVIPTFNDTENEIKQIARFVSELEGVNKIHLLPYHRLGQDKYKNLGRKYELENIIPPTKEKMIYLKQAVLNVSNIDCQIGG